ncbi:MAG: STAS domain-containing protein [Planctomycetota bacterium]|jgi:anti-anti-sigma factor|nr:STAS domain-containing protein [Planctomycetota bacterium]
MGKLSRPGTRQASKTGACPEGGETVSISGDFLRVSRANEAIRVEVFGLGNMHLAPAFQSFAEAEIQAGFVNFIVDLHGCAGMDSTFMGTFIGISNQIRGRQGFFCLVNVSPENHRLLKMLGVVHLVTVHEGEFPVPAGKTTIIRPTDDPYARQRQIRAAHFLLLDADPANRDRFGAFIKAMEEAPADAPTIVRPGKNGTGSDDKKK